MMSSKSQSDIVPGPGNYNAGLNFGKGVPAVKIGLKNKDMT